MEEELTPSIKGDGRAASNRSNGAYPPASNRARSCACITTTGSGSHGASSSMRRAWSVTRSRHAPSTTRHS
jgi:hypothetical protein